MSVKVCPLPNSVVPAQSIEVAWEGGQFVLIVAAKGLLACGVVDPVVMNRFGAAVAVARGTVERPLVTADDLLQARIAEVTDAAQARGITPGMSGTEALQRLG